MTVSPWLHVSSEGPVNLVNDMVHFRQGDMDGACGPYSLVMALVTLQVLTRQDVEAMYSWKGNTRKGKFKKGLTEHGALVSGGTDKDDLLSLANFFHAEGVVGEYVQNDKRTMVAAVQKALDKRAMPIIGVRWAGKEGHWMMVVGYQGVRGEDNFQITHLLCLDPGSERPITSLWNAVIAVFDADGKSVRSGQLPSEHWDSTTQKSPCAIFGVVLISRT